MGGFTVLYIDSVDNIVVRVPQPKEGNFKAVKTLSNKEILCVMLFYETRERKPAELIKVDFIRQRLDPEGVFSITHEKSAHVYNFAFATPELLARQESPLSLPVAPCVPTTDEKRTLYQYLNNKFPVLAKDAPSFIEAEIRCSMKIHRENVDMVKKANRIRNVN